MSPYRLPVSSHSTLVYPSRRQGTTRGFRAVPATLLRKEALGAQQSMVLVSLAVDPPNRLTPPLNSLLNRRRVTSTSSCGQTICCLVWMIGFPLAPVRRTLRKKDLVHSSLSDGSRTPWKTGKLGRPKGNPVGKLLHSPID